MQWDGGPPPVLCLLSSPPSLGISGSIFVPSDFWQTSPIGRFCMRFPGRVGSEIPRGAAVGRVQVKDVPTLLGAENVGAPFPHEATLVELIGTDNSHYSTLGIPRTVHYLYLVVYQKPSNLGFRQ